MSASLVVAKLQRWKELLEWLPLRHPSPAHRQIMRELDEEIANARELAQRDELRGLDAELERRTGR